MNLEEFRCNQKKSYENFLEEFNRDQRKLLEAVGEKEWEVRVALKYPDGYGKEFEPKIYDYENIAEYQDAFLAYLNHCVSPAIDFASLEIEKMGLHISAKSLCSVYLEVRGKASELLNLFDLPFVRHIVWRL